jgi:hypothetical protein
VSGLRKKPKPSGKISNTPSAITLFTSAGALLDDGERQLLLAHAAGVFDLKCFGLLEDFRARAVP